MSYNIGEHARKSSAGSIQTKSARVDTLAAPSASPALDSRTANKKNVVYTVFVRVPFARNGFEDPVPVEWDASKDKALWKVISKAGNSREINWQEESVKFGVSLSFLLQQAAWLYERHFEGMKAQMKRLSAGPMSSAASPDLSQAAGAGSLTVGGIKMERTGSKGSRTGSGSAGTPILVASTRENQNSSVNAATAGLDGTSVEGRPTISRTPSTATVTQSKMNASGVNKAIPVTQRALRTSSGSKRRPSLLQQPANANHDVVDHDEVTSSESEDEPSYVPRSQIFRRNPLGSQRTKAPSLLRTLSSDGDGEHEGDKNDDDDDDDDDDEVSGDGGGFLPFAVASSTSRKAPSASHSRQERERDSNRPKPHAQTARPTTLENILSATESSASSASSLQPKVPNEAPTPHRADALSPRHRAQLASLSPRSRREGSEGSPSMGSSFSDLDDASVTQSALEEALMSNMRAQGTVTGSMVNRMRMLPDVLGRRN